MRNRSIIHLEQVSKVYRQNTQEVWALREIDLALSKGEFIAIMGPSGSGKSTLLNLMGGLDRPTSGKVTVDGHLLSVLSDDEMTQLRRKTIGVVFQAFHLLQHLTVWENVALPLLLRGDPHSAVRTVVSAYLDSVGLSSRQGHRPHQLSSGEQQRVAIARALVIQPAVLLADEPTGNLDSSAGGNIIGLIKTLASKQAVTVALVTHSLQAASFADRILRIKDGKIERDPL